MRVVIVTGKAPHHKYLCTKIAEFYNVVGILHPVRAGLGAAGSIRRITRGGRSYGWVTMGSHLLERMFSRFENKRSLSNGGLHLVDFSDGVAAYDRIPGSLIHAHCDMRDTDAHALLRSLQPDVTLCLGGPVYPKAFIDASPLTLNFHSGVSPLYNGTASIRFAFANGHLHLCGGTLMIMSTEIDGGRVLGHYLPAIESGDSPESLFEKTVRGAATMYTRILGHLNVLTHLHAKGAQLQSVSQTAPLFYTRGFELGWRHKKAISRYLAADLAAQFERREKIVEYWRAHSEAEASQLYRSTLDQLLWDRAPSKHE
jgi:folate-dependent phosphoribosylglycinamide formyltransferase PurN